MKKTDLKKSSSRQVEGPKKAQKTASKPRNTKKTKKSEKAASLESSKTPRKGKASLPSQTFLARKKELLSYLKQAQQEGYLRQIQKCLDYTKKRALAFRPLLKKHSQYLIRGMLAFWNDPLSYLKRLQKRLGLGFQRAELFLRKFMETPHSFFHLFLTLIVTAFLALNLLSASNPFRLFFPFLSFPIPPRNENKLITFYAISRKNASLIAMRQELLLSKNLGLNLRLLASLVAQPLHSKIRPGQNYTDLEVLPLLGNSIRRVWEPYPGHIIIDLSKNAIDSEMQVFHRTANNAKKDSYYQDAFFRAFTSSIFEAKKGIKSLEFWLDAKSLQLPGMSFDLRQKYRLGYGF